MSYTTKLSDKGWKDGKDGETFNVATEKTDYVRLAIDSNYICGFYAVNKKHCIPTGLDHCVVCNKIRGRL